MAEQTKGYRVLPSGSAQVRLRLEGHQFHEVYTTEAEAINRVQQLRFLHGRKGDLDLAAGTIEALIDAHQVAQKGYFSPKTLRHYLTLKSVLPGELLATPLNKLTVGDVERAIRVLSEGRSRVTVESYLRALAAILGWAKTQGWVLDNAAGQARMPRAAVAPVKRQKVIPVEMFDAAMGRLLKDDPYAACLLAVLYYTGCRWGEARALQRRDLDFGAGVLTIVRSQSEGQPVGPTKSGKARTVLLPRFLVDLLLAHAHPKLTKDDDLLLPAGGGGQWWAAHFRRVTKWSTAFPGYRIHDTRATATTLALIASGGDLGAAQEWIGHADPRTTAGYITPAMKDSGLFLQKMEDARNRGSLARPWHESTKEGRPEVDPKAS